MNPLHVVASSCIFFASLPGQYLLRAAYGTQSNGLTGSLVAIANDLDGDRVPDLLISSPGWALGRVDVVSGANGSTRFVRSAGTMSIANGILMGTKDLNRDGLNDILIDFYFGTGEGLMALSGANLAVLWQTQTTNLNYISATSAGDLDGDGIDDFGVIVQTSGIEYLWTLRGSNGSQIQANLTLPGQTRSFVELGDINGDGRPELVRGGQRGSIDVLQTSPPTILASIPAGSDWIEVQAADMAGDARNEIVAGVGGAVRVFDARSGALVRTMPGDQNFRIVGDLNADGVPDFAEFTFNRSILNFRSGANGDLLSQWPSTPGFSLSDWAAGGDVDGEGYGDLLLGDRFAQGTGAWQLLSGRVLATMQAMPASCAQGPFFGAPAVAVGSGRLSSPA